MLLTLSSDAVGEEDRERIDPQTRKPEIQGCGEYIKISIRREDLFSAGLGTKLESTQVERNI
jgi:hypothetical protein